jgi:tRNA 2-thiocytidine biosynthesis protein TtcA
MIQDGDRILVAVSGGKDSLTLLKLLSDRRAFVPIDYEVLAVHIDLDISVSTKSGLGIF